MDDTYPVSPFQRGQTNPRDPDSADDPVSRLLPESNIPRSEYPADEKNGFTRTWLATSSSVRPNRDPIHIQWGIHWYTPVSILLLLLAGTTSAIGHHFFYRYLDNSLVGGEAKQRWALWIGSGLSFLTKVMLTAALGISRTQWVWLTLRNKWFTLDGIDALFGIISDPALFLNWRMIKKAKIATIMAIGMWIFPLAAILTPGTISVHTVPPQIPLWSNLTRHVTITEFWISDEAKGIGLYIPEVIRSLQLPIYTGFITHFVSLPPVDLPSLSTVGTNCGANCTYTVEFLGPAIACGEMTTWKNTDWVNSSDYMDGSSYRGTRNTRGFYSFILSLVNPENTQHPTIFIKCKPAIANYTVKQIIVERRFLEPEITKFEKAVLSAEVAGREDITRYYPLFTLLDSVWDTLKGTRGFREEVDSRNLFSMLGNDTYASPSVLGSTIEHMAQIITVSMIAFGVPLEGDGNVLDIAAIQETNCTATEYKFLYAYSASTLLVVYGLAIASAFATTVAGFIALRQNGMASNRSVSTFIRTTRNRTLDDCIIGADCLGGDVISSELGRVKLQFGALNANRQGTAPFALGIKGEISPIKRD